MTQFSSQIYKIEFMTGNWIWVGKVMKQQVLDYSFMGVTLRGSMIARDLRNIVPYDKYDEVHCIGSVVWELETDGGV